MRRYFKMKSRVYAFAKCFTFLVAITYFGWNLNTIATTSISVNIVPSIAIPVSNISSSFASFKKFVSKTIETARLVVMQESANAFNVVNMTHLSSGSQNIFMIETNETMDKVSGRVLCALESAARHNPGSKVYLVLSDKVSIHAIPDWLTKQRNLYFVKVSFDELMKDTPCESFWQRNPFQLSKHKLVHKADLVRVVLVYKYGGAYMDTGTVLC